MASKRRIAAWVLGMLGVALFGLAVAATVVASSNGPEIPYGGCKAPDANDGAAGAHPGTGQTSLKLRDGQSTTVAFGRSRIAKAALILLDSRTEITDPATPLHVTVDDFRRADDGRLYLKDVVAHAYADGSTVRLMVCFGRQNNHLGDPGTYAGSVTIDDARLVAPVTVPLTVTMQYVHGFILLWLFLPVIVPGAWVLWVLNTRREHTANAFAVRELLKWVRTVGGLVAVVTATVASVGVYVATFLRDPTWGASALEPLSLFGAMFSAFVTTGGITQLARLAQSSGPPGALTHQP